MSKANDLASLLADGVVGTAELDSGAVTLAKLADNSVNADKLDETASYVIAGLDVSGGQIHDVASIYRGAISSTEAGIGLGSDGSVSFLYGTTEGARFSGEGRLGFGTQSPLGVIDIKNSVTPMIKMGYGGVNGEHKIGWDSAGMVISADGGATSSLSYISLQVFGNEALKIKSSGNVGLGIANPAHKLDVAGGIGIAGTEVITSTGQIVTAQLQDSGVAAGSYGSAAQVPVITVDAKGRVTSASTTAVAGVSSTAYNSSTGVLTINTSDGGSFTEDLGIGTSDSPTFAGLDVDGNVRIANPSYYTGTYHWTLSQNASSGYFAINYYGQGDDFIIRDNGNVGIGTINPVQKLDVVGNIAVSGTVDGRDIAVDGAKLDGIESGATADQTASEILALVKTVDGSGSGLDSDTLDGQHGSYYTGYTDTAIANLIDNSPSTLDTLNELAAALGDDPNFATTVSAQIGTKLNASSYTAADVLAKIKTVDGAGSGLDADLLDGLGSAQFLRSDANDSTSGNLAVGGTFNTNYRTVLGSSISRPDNLATLSNSHVRMGGQDVYLHVASLNNVGNYAVALQSGRESDNASFPMSLQPNGGNVGIGTTNPVAKLHVAGQILAGAGAGINLVLDDNAEGAKWGFATGGYNLSFMKNNGSGTYETKVIFDQNGNVGIGTNSPGEKLDVVNGNLRLYANSTLTDPPYIQLNHDVAAASGPSSGRITIATSSQNAYSGDLVLQPRGYYNGAYEYVDNVLRVSAYKRVGINTSSPTHALDIRGGDVTIYGGVDGYNADQERVRLYMGNNNAHVGAMYNYGLFFDPGNGAGDAMMIRQATGYVGINDNTPSYHLDVNGTIRATGDVIADSDVRLKSDIQTISNAVETVKSLRGTAYIKDGKASIGVIAQEIEEVLPQVVSTADDEMGTKSVAYGNIVAVLIEAIKEQQGQIDELKKLLEAK